MMMKLLVLCSLMGLMVRGQDAAAPAPESAVEGGLEGSVVCQKYPHLNLCQLHTVLRGAMEELEILLLGDEEGITKEKRKSAFVRFGKRKSAFVRFGKRGQQDQEQEKRKSSYIRFG
jgi:hypothetical protein